MIMRVLVSWFFMVAFCLMAMARDQYVLQISMIDLIANVKRHQDREYIVSGYFKLVDGGAALFLHKDDWELGLDKNGVFLDVHVMPLDARQFFDGKYVSIRARVAKERFTPRFFSCKLYDLSLCVELRRGDYSPKSWRLLPGVGEKSLLPPDWPPADWTSLPSDESEKEGRVEK